MKSYYEHLPRKGSYSSKCEMKLPDGLAGKDGSIDAVYANSSLNLAFDLRQALAEMFRVLVPGGYLHLSGVFSERDVPKKIAEELRFAGNVFATSLTLFRFKAMLLEVGFARAYSQKPSPFKLLS